MKGHQRQLCQQNEEKRDYRERERENYVDIAIKERRGRRQRDRQTVRVRETMKNMKNWIVYVRFYTVQLNYFLN
jgi:hypothetical protein